MAAFAIDDLTAEEEKELLKYLAFLRLREQMALAEADVEAGQEVARRMILAEAQWIGMGVPHPDRFVASAL